eukprot:1653089-Pyramimonas_sp.AAC.1
MLCKIGHTWRDTARGIFIAWAGAHGAGSAVHHAQRLPPIPVSGRWGTVDRTEQYLAKPGMRLVAPVFVSVVGKVEAKDKAARALPDAAGQSTAVDAHAIEETKEYKVKVGRWRRDALSGVQNKAFWAVLEISTITRAPLTHFLAFNQQRRTSAPKRSQNPPPPDAPSLLMPPSALAKSKSPGSPTISQLLPPWLLSGLRAFLRPRLASYIGRFPEAVRSRAVVAGPRRRPVGHWPRRRFPI